MSNMLIDIKANLDANLFQFSHAACMSASTDSLTPQLMALAQILICNARSSVRYQCPDCMC